MAQFGSLINLLSGTPKDLVPEVGMGATLVCWSDREPYTVIAVSASGKTITLQADEYKRTDSNGMSDSQAYDYRRNPHGEICKARLTKRGWKSLGQKVVLGGRSRYHDYSF